MNQQLARIEEQRDLTQIKMESVCIVHIICTLVPVIKEVSGIASSNVMYVIDYRRVV